MQWQAQGGIESLNLMIKVAIDGCCASVVPGNLRFCEACDAFRIRPRDLCNFSLCSRGKNFDRNRARPTASHITGTLVSDIRMIFVQLFCVAFRVYTGSRHTHPVGFKAAPAN